MTSPLAQGKCEAHQSGFIALLAPLAADVERRDAAPQVLQQLQAKTRTS